VYAISHPDLVCRATTFGKESLVALLRDSAAAAHFRKFLEKDFADNSLDFYEGAASDGIKSVFQSYCFVGACQQM
jgi:hypothetical protein